MAVTLKQSEYEEDARKLREEQEKAQKEVVTIEASVKRAEVRTSCQSQTSE